MRNCTKCNIVVEKLCESKHWNELPGPCIFPPSRMRFARGAREAPISLRFGL